MNIFETVIHSHPRICAVRIIGILGFLCLALANCSSGTHQSQLNGLPLSVVSTQNGDAWAVVPMGKLTTQNNTFWELWHRGKTSATFKLVTPPGVADNSGLVAAFSRSKTVAVGFDPSQNLDFSPLAFSSDSGNHWNVATLPGPLIPGPFSLAFGDDQNLYALVKTDQGALLEAHSPYKSWKLISNTTQLKETQAGEMCGLTGLNALGLENGQVVLGVSCTNGAHVVLGNVNKTRVQLISQHFPLTQNESVSIDGFLTGPKDEELLIVNNGGNTYFSAYPTCATKCQSQTSVQITMKFDSIANSLSFESTTLIVSTQSQSGKRTYRSLDLTGQKSRGSVSSDLLGLPMTGIGVVTITKPEPKVLGESKTTFLIWSGTSHGRYSMVRHHLDLPYGSST